MADWYGVYLETINYYHDLLEKKGYLLLVKDLKENGDDVDKALLAHPGDDEIDKALDNTNEELDRIKNLISEMRSKAISEESDDDLELETS